MQPENRSKVRVNKPNEADLQEVLHGLAGIFWALDQIVVHGASDEITHERDRAQAIANLIVAGHQLAEDITDRI